MKKRWIWLLLVCLVLAGCTEDIPEPTQTQPPTTQTVPPETTQVTVPVTEPTVATEPPPEPLVFDESQFPEFTMEPALLISGTADPGYPVKIGETSIVPGEDGRFSLEYPLQMGENVIRIRYLDEDFTYSVDRRYAAGWFLHKDGATYGTTAMIYAEIFAREGSTVEIQLGDEVQKPEPSHEQKGFGVPEGFLRYVCRFKAPQSLKNQKDLGPITYRVTYEGVTEEYVTGNILCNASVELKYPDYDVTPEGYRNVGSGYIVEVVDVTAETFNGETMDDKSRPMWNYLPKGTLDYGSQTAYYNESADRYYHLLRCGIRVYKRSENKPYGNIPIVDCYTGVLPDHNEINVAGFEIDGHHTQLTLDCLWKAPFYFKQDPQDYRHEDGNGYILDDYDAEYVDITFCYATVFTGAPEIPADHPLFASAEIIRNAADYTLRLHLKEPGCFYGWNAFYNEKDQLCFRFLNPQKATPADNAYGADLTGLRIMIDVGHGGEDGGAGGRDTQGTYWRESERNLNLALLLKAELESIGAEVIMNRTDNEYNLSRTERIAYLLEQEPDYCICVHHNSNTDKNRNGFSSWYYTPFSRDAADHIQRSSADTGVYTTSTLAWYYYYISRQTVCPIVLAESGYLSNKYDADRIGDPEANQQKARDLTQGIVNYYLAQNP